MTFKHVLIVVTVLLLLTGCSGRKYTKTEIVEGVVTLDGVPVEGADILFFPASLGSGESGTAKTDEKGYYRISSIKGAPEKGTVTGEYSVTISKAVTTKLDKPYAVGGGETLIQFETKELLPTYADMDYPQLTATIVPGKNVVNFDLDSKAVIVKPK